MRVGMRQEQKKYMISTATSAMGQYHEIKSQYPDAILFYRMGDFNEMFYEDGKIVSKIFDIVLTIRYPNKDNLVFGFDF